MSKTIVIYQDTIQEGGVRRVSEILTNEFCALGNRVIWLIGKRFYHDSRDYPIDLECIYMPEISSDRLSIHQFLLDFVQLNNVSVIINQEGLSASTSLFSNLQYVKVMSVVHNNPMLNYSWLFYDLMRLRNDTSIEKLKRVARFLLYPKIKFQLKKSIDKTLNRLNSAGTILFLSKSYIKASGLENNKNCLSIANPNNYKFYRYAKNKENLVIFVGRLDNRSKNILELLKIWKKIYKKVNDWKLIIIGEGPDKDIISKKARDLHNVELVGFCNPLPYYQRASILCMTSIFEGFPMCITEAMQNGCVPIIYNSFPAAEDMIQSTIDGILVKPFDRKDFSIQLLNLIQNDEMRIAMANSAVENIKRYDSKIILEQWKKLIN